MTALLVDGSTLGADVLRQVFSGFGVRQLLWAHSGAEAQEILRLHEINLIVASDQLPDMPGYELINWLRHSKIESNAFSPAIIVSAHTRRSMVDQARDCGANYILAKPISTKVLLERVIWVAKESRPFVQTEIYLGPDRRFHDLEVPPGGGRRRGDLAAPPVSSGEAA